MHFKLLAYRLEIRQFFISTTVLILISVLLSIHSFAATEAESSAATESVDSEEWAYQETLALCEQVPLILPDLVSIHPRDTTSLLSLKPFIEGFHVAARKGRIIRSSQWLEAITKSPGFTRALGECYPDSGYATDSRRQLLAKLYMYEVVGKIAAATTLGLALEPLHDYMASVIESAQERLHESLEKFSYTHN